MNDDVKPRKQQIRRNAIALRTAMKRSEKQKRDFIIASKVLGLWKFRESPCVLLYCSTALEVDTRHLIERAWALGKTVALPRCGAGANDMAFFAVRGWADLEPGMFSVLEPKEHCPPVPEDRVSICIVPGLAFDRTGYRTGYGKGYYDRFLASYRGATIGLNYSCCMEEEIPHERYDRKVDVVVTDVDTYFCND